jgi:hypothetical protein
MVFALFRGEASAALDSIRVKERVGWSALGDLELFSCDSVEAIIYLQLVKLASKQHSLLS